MKTVKLILLTCGMIFCLGLNNSYAQDSDNKQTVIIRMMECFSIFKGEIMVLHPDGTSHTTAISTLKLKEFGTTSADNSKILQKEIDTWKQEGFTVNGISNASGGDNIIFTTVLMSKD